MPQLLVGQLDRRGRDDLDIEDGGEHVHVEAVVVQRPGPAPVRDRLGHVVTGGLVDVLVEEAADALFQRCLSDAGLPDVDQADQVQVVLAPPAVRGDDGAQRGAALHVDVGALFGQVGSQVVVPVLGGAKVRLTDVQLRDGAADQLRQLLLAGARQVAHRISRARR